MMSLGTNAIDAQREAYRRLGLVLTDEMIADAGAASDAFELLGMQFTARINASIATQADNLVTLGEALADVATFGIEAAGGITAFLEASGDDIGAFIAGVNGMTAAIEAVPSPSVTTAGLQELRDLLGDADTVRVGDVRDRLRAALGDETQVENLASRGGISRFDQPSNIVSRGGRVALVDALTRLIDIRVARAANTPAADPPETVPPGDLPPATPPLRISPAATASSGPETIPTPNLHPQRQAEAFYDSMIALAATKGVQFANAQTKANIDAMDARRGEYREFFRSGFRDGILAALDGNAGEALSSWWREYITRAMSGILDNLADKVFDALSSSGGGSGIGATIASIFGGTRAGGGPVSAGRSYTVGENGPERFVPRTAGRILPDRAPMGGAGQAAAPVVKLIVDEGTMFAARVEQISGPIAIQAGQGAYARASGDAARRAQAASYRLR